MAAQKSKARLTERRQTKDKIAGAGTIGGTTVAAPVTVDLSLMRSTFFDMEAPLCRALHLANALELAMQGMHDLLIDDELLAIDFLISEARAAAHMAHALWYEAHDQFNGTAE